MSDATLAVLMLRIGCHVAVVYAHGTWTVTPLDVTGRMRPSAATTLARALEYVVEDADAREDCCGECRYERAAEGAS